MAKLSATVDIRILDLDQAKRLFAAAEDRLEKLTAVQEAGKELLEFLAAVYRAIEKLPLTPRDDITDLIETELALASIPFGVAERFRSAVDAAVELVVEKDDGRRFVPDGRGGEIEVTTHGDLTGDQAPE